MIKNKIKKAKKTQKNNFLKKFKKIKLVVTDVDGVLTDGGMYYSEKGEVIKKFNTRDGMGVELLASINIPTVFLTKEESKIAKKRAAKVKAKIYTNVTKKEILLKKLCKKFCVEKNEIAYIGDDVNDLKIMKKVGLSVSPSDAVNIVKQNADYVSKLKGGKGVFRKVADLILSTKNLK